MRAKYACNCVLMAASNMTFFTDKGAPALTHWTGAGRYSCYRGSDLADQIQRRGQSLLAFLPGSGADFARVRVDILRGLDLAQQFSRVTANAASGDLDNLDLAVRIDHEGATISHASV